MASCYKRLRSSVRRPASKKHRASAEWDTKSFWEKAVRGGNVSVWTTLLLGLACA
jgi:hypothetical protein